MMRLCFDKDRVVTWANERMPPTDTEKAQSVIGVEDPKTGELIAAAIFHNYKGHDIEIGFCADSPRWAQRGVIRAIFHYVFDQLGCIRLTTITGENNARARRFDEYLGFVQEGIHPHGMAPGETAISYGMMKDQCRWLR